MLGPVFRFELITTARRKRYYVARFVYGLFLLFSLGSQYGRGDWSRYATVNLTRDSIDEMNQFSQQMFAALAWARRFGRGGWLDARLVLNGALRESSTFLFVLTLLSVASAAAVSMTSEREQDTWTSLTATLLTDREIVLAKIRGALWSSRRLLLALLIMWSVGLLAGAIYPLGALAAVVGLFVFCGFTATLGVWISLRAKDSTRALFATIFWLLVCNGGYLVLVPAPARESDLMVAGVMPYMEWAALISYRDASLISSSDLYKIAGASTIAGVETIMAYLIAVVGYGLGTLVLSGAAVHAFAKAVDRPRRDTISADKARKAA